MPYLSVKLSDSRYTPIEVACFSPRTLNALICAGIGSVEQLQKVQNLDTDVPKLHQLGKDEVISFLDKLNGTRVNRILEKVYEHKRAARELQLELDTLALQARRKRILTEREYLIYKCRFHMNQTYTECGKRLGCTRERIAQLEKIVLGKIAAFDQCNSYPLPHD